MKVDFWRNPFCPPCWRYSFFTACGWGTPRRGPWPQIPTLKTWQDWAIGGEKTGCGSDAVPGRDEASSRRGPRTLKLKGGQKMVASSS